MKYCRCERCGRFMLLEGITCAGEYTVRSYYCRKCGTSQEVFE